MRALATRPAPRPIPISRACRFHAVGLSPVPKKNNAMGAASMTILVKAKMMRAVSDSLDTPK